MNDVIAELDIVRKLKLQNSKSVTIYINFIVVMVVFFSNVSEDILFFFSFWKFERGMTQA